jgi:hypothetical protein
MASGVIGMAGGDVYRRQTRPVRAITAAIVLHQMLVHNGGFGGLQTKY